jgi:hypothetical protein
MVHEGESVNSPAEAYSAKVHGWEQSLDAVVKSDGFKINSWNESSGD